MNVLFLVGGWGVGGVERVTRVLADGMAARGWGVSIVAHRMDDRTLLESAVDKIKVFELPDKNRVAALRKILVDEKVDVVINQWCVPYKITRLINAARKRLSVKLVAVHHNPPDKNQRILRARNPIMKWMAYAITAINARLVYEKSDAVVVLSEGFMSPFCGFIGRRACPKLFAIANPLTLPVPYEVDVARKNKTILYVGRLEETQKRVSRIIEAWRDLADDYPEWRLEIVGDGHDREGYEKLAHGAKRIYFAGMQSPVRYYETGSLLMLTSDYEGFGLVIVEAMAYGVVPIVYGSYPAVYDIIDDGKNGLIIPTPYSHNVVVATIKKLMDNPERIRAMSSEAIEKSKQFTLDAVLDKWKQLMEVKI